MLHSSTRAALTALLAATISVPAFSQSSERHSHPVRTERERPADILHYRIELELDHPRKAFSGRTTVTFAPLRATETLHLDAASFVVTGVSRPDGRLLRFSHSDGRLAIDLGREVSLRDTLSVTVEYHAENYDVEGARYGMARRPDLGLDFRDETEDNPPLVNSLSFPEGARHWYPSHDHPAERATQDLIATVARDWRVLSNGRLVDVSYGDSTATYHWKQELTHPTYLSAVIAGPYVVIADSLGRLPVSYWVYPKDERDALRSFGRTPEIVAFFERTYGVPFPWAKYDQVTVPGIGGGAESTTATLIGESAIHDERADVDYPTHWLVAHEAAHQWWGNLVTYRDWTHTWISESFGSYSEVLWAEHDLGTDNGLMDLLNKRAAYLNEARTSFMRPIVYDRWRFPNDNFDRHTYQKGANVLHMLRSILGDEPFFRLHQYFLTRHAYQAVSTADFVEATKDATGVNLDWFYEQWLFKPGHPVIEASHDFSPADSTVTLRLQQTQTPAGDIPVYRLPIDVELLTESGSIVHNVLMTEREQVFRFALPTAPLSVVVDPDRVLLAELSHEKSRNEFARQLELGGLGARLEAVAGLARQDGTEPYLTSALTDGFWAVREAAVRGLSALDAGTHDLFTRVVLEDPDSRVRAAAVLALGSGGAEASAFLRERWDREKSYRVQAAMLTALGNIGRAEDAAFLTAALSLSSPRNVLAQTAQRALDAMSAGQ